MTGTHLSHQFDAEPDAGLVEQTGQRPGGRFCGEHRHSHPHHHSDTHDHDHAHPRHHDHHAPGHHSAPDHVYGQGVTHGDTIVTVRAAAGLSGDMMLSGLAKLADLSSEQLQALAREIKLPTLGNAVELEERSVNAITGWGCRITLAEEHTHRTLSDIETIIRDSDMPDAAKILSQKAFHLLAEAEGAVHGARPETVTFHEIGALDSILDTCLVCRIFTMLAPKRFVCSPLPLADGVIRCAHGLMLSPAPAVAHLLHGVPVHGFSGQGETVTPTALSLLKALDAEFGSWPAMTVQTTVISYGDKIFSGAPNGALWALGTA